MAALYGRLQGSRGEVTRMGSDCITAKLETWHGAVRVELDRDGMFRVFTGSKSSPSNLVASGKVEA